MASNIFEEKNNNQLNNGSFAVLYRTNAQSRSIEDALRKANIDYQERAYKDPDIVLPSLENTKNITGWSPKTDIKSGVENTVKWYFENRDLIKNLKYL